MNKAVSIGSGKAHREPRIVRIAVVGAGDIGRRHMRAIAEDRAYELAAVVDPLPVGAAAAADFGSAYFTDLRAMLDVAKPHGVIIATPNGLHVPLAQSCLARGIPVLVEKPISDSVESAYALADLSDATGIPVLVGHHRRHNPLIQGARALVESGLIGEVTAISASWLVRKPDDYFDVAWRGEPGGGPVLINLIHDIDCLRYIAGEITFVQGMASNRRRRLQVEDTAALLIRFENGALGTIIVSDAAPSPWSWELTSGEVTSYAYPTIDSDCYRIAGSIASLGVPSMRVWRHDGHQSWRSPMVEERRPVSRADPLAIQIRHFADVILGTTCPVITARDAARTLEVTLAVTESARTGAAIVLPVATPGPHRDLRAPRLLSPPTAHS